MSRLSNTVPRRRLSRALGLVASIAAVTFLSSAGLTAQAIQADPSAAAQAPDVSVEQAVRDALGNGESPAVMVRFRGAADLSAAFGMVDRDARATYVYETLRNFADRSQSQSRRTLASQFSLSESAHDYTVLWIDNSIAVERLSAAMLGSLQSDPNIESIRTQKLIPLPVEPVVDIPPWTPNDAVSSLVHINVPQVWDLGFKGAGVVVANIDTGVRYTHQALVGKYRGNLGGGTFDHQFNWYDPYNHTATPRTSANHGSHTMGTMIGDGGTSTTQIGAAPDAKWIACIGFGSGGSGATEAGLIECGQWTLAPYATSGSGTPDPTKHADVVNNSWGDCGRTYDTWYENVINGWIAAGVAPVFSNGNASNCGYANNPPLNTVGNPGRSGKVLGIGSTGTNNGVYAPHSNKGPTDNANTGLPNYPDPAGFPNLKPNVVAPGVNINSANSTSDTAYFLNTGTSMSAPASAGVIALMWSAAPCLHGNYGMTGTLLMSSATAIPVATGSPSDGPGNVPNQATGWGEINALAAVNASIAFCQSGGDIAPTVAKSFNPATVANGDDSLLTITLSNANATEATLDAVLTDSFPADLVASATPAAATTCVGGTAAATAGGTSVTLTSGAKIPANGSCTVSVSVTSAANGSYVNTIAAGALSTDKGDNASDASATLVVNEGGAVFPAPYCPVTFPSNVEPISRVVIGGIDNPSDPTLNGTPALEDFTAILGTLGVGSSASIAVEGNTDGAFTTYISAFIDWNHNGTFDAGEGYDIGPIASSTGADGIQATGTIAVPADALTGNTRLRVVKKYSSSVSYPTACNTEGYGQAEDYTVSVTGGGGPVAPTVAKAFAPASIATGATSTLTITLANANATAATLSAALTDAFPAGLAVAAAPAAATTCGGSVTAVAGSASVVLTGGAIPPTGSCTVTVDVTSATAASYINTIAAGALQTDAGNNAAAATATLTVTGGGGSDPAISVTPSPLAFTVDVGASDSDDLAIGNTGSGTLTFSIDEAPQARPTSYLTARRALASKNGRMVRPDNTLQRGPRAGSAALPVRSTSSVLGVEAISQMDDNTPGDEGVSCGVTGTSTADNSWWRRFYFNEYPTVGASTGINSVKISSGSAGPAGLPFTINLYTTPHSTPIDTISTGALTLIGSATGTIDSGLLEVTVPVSGNVADTVGTDLVVEFHTDGTETGQFFPGANATPETHPTYLSSEACGLSDPTAATDIGFPDFHLTMVVGLGEGTPPTGGCDNPSDVAWLSVVPATGSVAAGASTTSTVTVDATGLTAGDYSANLCVASNDPVTPLVTVPVALTVNGVIDDAIFVDGFDGASGPFEQPIADPGFEATTADAGPNPDWTGTDSNDSAGGTPFWSNALRNGSFGVWGGGWRMPGTQAWSQSVVITSGGSRWLNYWRNVVLAPDAATLTISVDGTVVASTDVAANGADADWTNISVDISAYADNAAHEIGFDYTATGAEDGNTFIDDVTIDETEGSTKR